MMSTGRDLDLLRGRLLVAERLGARRLSRVSLVLAVAVTWACGGGGTQEAAAPPPPEVVVATVEAKDVAIHSEWVGTTDGSVNAQIRARVQGYLQSQDYVEGTLVKPGTLLFTIDARPYRAALDAANGDLGRAEALLTKTQQDVARYTPLAKEGAISQQELDNAVQANRGARAAVDSARAGVEKARLDLDWTQLKAPIAGIAGISVAQVGDLIGSNTVLTTVSQVDPIKVSFPISEQEYLRYADRIQLDGGSQQKGTLELILADGNVYAERGTASVANRQVDVKTGTLLVVSLFPNPRNLIRPGQYAKVRAAIETKQAAVVVPQRAVQEVQGTHQVAVVGADNKVSIRRIKTGPQVDNALVVDEGLAPGERIVVDGLQRVRDGVVVSPKPLQPAASP
jgi:membrane fusion protein (multidrug efflux system)